MYMSCTSEVVELGLLSSKNCSFNDPSVSPRLYVMHYMNHMECGILVPLPVPSRFYLSVLPTTDVGCS